LADPAALAAAVKAAALLKSKEAGRGISWIIAAVFSPLILIIIVAAALFSGTAQHNSNAVNLCFNGGYMPSGTPPDFRQNIRSMQESFALLDSALEEISRITEGGSVDIVRVKAVYFSLFFGAGRPADAGMFADCFVKYEQKEDGEETEMTAVPIESLAEIYAGLEAAIGRSISVDERNNAAEVYRYVMYGADTPVYGAAFDEWIAGLPVSAAPFIGADGFRSPLGEGWRSMVTSEFGYRADPFTKKREGHAGIDLGAASGTPLRAALPGTVSLVRHASAGYGYHVMVDHGGGFLTLYAHCSKILVYEGQEVSAGDVIAKLGSTGRSTGPHLHFEVIVNGEKKNPRSYLP
jgi:murein DD-endopeptidase MepM/ murein hydrolase activator NlpD